MKGIIKYYSTFLSNTTKSLNKKGFLIGKTWFLIDENKKVQKLIFKKDKRLLFSHKGKVIEGLWDYYPDTRNLYIDKGDGKILLNELYIDDNVLIFQIDGTDYYFFSLANEKTLPDYNIPEYLLSVTAKNFKIWEEVLENGSVLQILYKNNSLIGCQVRIIDKDYNLLDIKDGVYYNELRNKEFHIKNEKLVKIKANNQLAPKEIAHLSEDHPIEVYDYKIKEKRYISKKEYINIIAANKEHLFKVTDYNISDEEKAEDQMVSEGMAHLPEDHPIKIYDYENKERRYISKKEYFNIIAKNKEHLYKVLKF